MRRVPMYMKGWVERLDAFLTLNEREILTHAGKISHDMAVQRAQEEYEGFRTRRLLEEAKKQPDDFEASIQALPPVRRVRGEFRHVRHSTRSLAASIRGMPESL